MLDHRLVKAVTESAFYLESVLVYSAGLDQTMKIRRFSEPLVTISKIRLFFAIEVIAVSCCVTKLKFRKIARMALATAASAIRPGRVLDQI